MQGKIDAIFDALNAIEKKLMEIDPSGHAWDLRVLAVQRMFQVINEPRFQLEPVSLDQVLRRLNDVLAHVEAAPETSADESAPVFEPGNDPDAVSERMQALYGMAWAQLSDAQYFDAADLLRRRIVNSNLDVSFIQDARCLDIATGIARWAVAMVHLGAREVLGIDYSNQCLEEAARRLAGTREEKSITLQYADLYKLPQEMDEAFDFVCANGVIHHLPDPGKGLEVMAHCTKKGGHAFVFMFTKADTPWWHCIEMMRRLLAPVPISYARDILSFYSVPGGQAFNTLDYSYTPIQYKLEREWMEDTLSSAGFTELTYLEGGAIHDSVLRYKLFETDRHLYGISETRYLLKK